MDSSDDESLLGWASSRRFCSSSSSFSEPSSSSPLPTKRSKVKINVAIESVRGGGGTGFGSITRQSTLDQFIARADLKPPPPDPQVVSDPVVITTETPLMAKLLGWASSRRFCSSSSSFSEPSSSSPLPTKRSKVKINVAIESVRGGGGTGFGSITRQSTLDQFIARADLKPPPPDPQVVSDPVVITTASGSIPRQLKLGFIQMVSKRLNIKPTFMCPSLLEPILVTYPESSAEATSFSGSTKPTLGSAAYALSDQAHPRFSDVYEFDREKQRQ
ncbi:hypothetical protein F2Q69_00047267 [Brassica cretica]|uniref:Uncharacterized protein n=1 Tax=Brassica cretica TaxID=69181 RepID=A0A8S9Q0T8_BRACR|nr:hypothetical protein F2Q69_00047267 [Brassica cretica]